jgi:hypothetical protein
MSINLRLSGILKEKCFALLAVCLEMGRILTVFETL